MVDADLQTGRHPHGSVSKQLRWPGRRRWQRSYPAAGPPTDTSIILGAILVVQQVEGSLLQPFVMGHAVRLHPAVILLSVAAGTVAAGVAGAVVAPLTAIAYRVVSILTATDTDSRADDGDTPSGDQPTSEELPSAVAAGASPVPEKSE